MSRIYLPNEASSCRTKPFGSACAKFGPDYARRLKRRQGRLGDTWFLDEVFVTINGQRQYLWRAVDQDGDLIDLLVQPPPGWACGAEIFSETLEGTATGAHASGDRQAGQLPSRTSGRHALGPPRHEAIREQSRRSLASTHATTRTSDAPASRHPTTRSGSCTSTVSFRIYFAWVDTYSGRFIIGCCEHGRSPRGPR